MFKANIQFPKELNSIAWGASGREFIPLQTGFESVEFKSFTGLREKVMLLFV